MMKTARVTKISRDFLAAVVGVGVIFDASVGVSVVNARPALGSRPRGTFQTVVGRAKHRYLGVRPLTETTVAFLDEGPLCGIQDVIIRGQGPHFKITGR